MGVATCPECRSAGGVIRAASVAPGTRMKLVTETAVRTIVEQLESEPVLTRERTERLVDVHLDIEGRAVRPIRWLALWTLVEAAVLALASLVALYFVSQGENPPPDPSQRVAEPVAIGMVTLYILALCVLPAAISTALWVHMITAPRQRERDGFQAKAQAAHEHAWLCARCHCFFFEHGHAPAENLPAGVAIPWNVYRHRLWKAVGFRRNVG